jgi:hypothetical protein
MLKKLVALVAIVSLSLTPKSLANAAVKAGSTCPKAGNTAIASGKTFTCIKSGKKLVWDKGVLVPKSATSPKTPELPPMPQDFQNLASNLEGIKYWAWKKVNLEIEKNNSVLGQVEIFTGPNTVPAQPNTIDKLTIGSKLFGTFNQIKKIYIIKFNYQDIEWAQTKYQLFQDQSWRSDYLTKAKNQCPDTRCRNAEIELNSKDEGIMMVGEIALSDQPKDKIENAGRYNGTREIHEYVHTIQMFNSSNSESRFNYGLLPRWMIEGQALWSAQAAVANSYDEYLELRNFDYPELRQMRPSYTAEWIEEFLNPNPVFIKNADNWQYWQKYPNYRVYDIGALANEILTAIKGPSAAMNLYVAVGKGATFADAFKQEFGINWNESVTYISKAIAAELDRMIKS